MSSASGTGRNSQQSVFFFGALALIPIFSAAASYYAWRNLLLGIFLLLGLMAFAGVRRNANDRSYELMICSLSLALLLASTFASRNLSGFDIHQEYYVFSQTIAYGWHPENDLVYNSVLSISILPAIIHLATGMNGILIFKTIFPILYSLVPIILYTIYRKFLSSQWAFLSVILFMSYPTSYVEITALGRQEIAELILVILLWVFLTPGFRDKLSGKTIIVLLTVGFVISHYSLAFVYVLLLTFSLLLATVTRKTTVLCTKGVFAFSVLFVLSWYLLTSQGQALGTLAAFIFTVSTGLVREFLNPLSRPTVVLEAFAFSGASGFLHLVNRFTQYLVQFCLVLGFVIFAVRIPKNSSGRTILSPMILALSLLLLSVALPFFAFGLNISRVYHIALLFISPCFVYGVGSILSFLRGRSQFIHFPSLTMRVPRRYVVAATLLTIYFLFVGGWVWSVSMDSPTSFVLDWQRMANSQSVDLKITFFSEYTVTEDIHAAQWLRLHISADRTVCGDFISTDHVLNSYGGFAKYLPQIPEECSYGHDYVYLSEFNVVNGTGTQLLASTNQIVKWQISDISSELSAMNVIYSGDSRIYLSP